MDFISIAQRSLVRVMMNRCHTQLLDRLLSMSGMTGYRPG
jgi:hypothetical protein